MDQYPVVRVAREPGAVERAVEHQREHQAQVDEQHPEAVRDCQLCNQSSIDQT